MKHLFFIIVIACVICTTSCKKEDCVELELADIVNTDMNGNIINQGNSDDWTPMNVADYPAFESLAFQPPPVPTNSGFQEATYPELPEGINFNCSTDSINFSFYPNPVISEVTPKLKVTSNKRFLDSAISYSPINGEISGAAYDSTPSVLTDAGYTILIDFTDGLLGWPGPENDVQLNIFVMTEDSCAYFTQGKIMYVQ